MSFGRGGRPRVQSGPFFGKQGCPRNASGPFPAKNTSSQAGGGASAAGQPRATAGGGKFGRLEFREFRGDLFQCPPSASLAHCVSEDMAMGKGIAKIFKSQFGGVKELKEQGVRTGGVAVLERKDRCIFYLVTKEKYSHKPTYDTLKSSLHGLRDQCSRRGIGQLCMPRIGCGLDRLEWGRVRQMIRDTFADCEVSITIYSLD